VDRYRDVLLIFSVPFGLTVGSFLNVCIFRLPRNCMSIVRPRSRCTRCLRLIPWYENLPVLSYLALGGRCRGCRAPISARYPLVELLTGTLFAATAYQHLALGRGRDEFETAVVTVVQMYLIACLIVDSFIDMDFRILPLEISQSGIVLSLVAVTAFPFLHAGSPILDLKVNAHLAGALSAAFGVLVGGGVIYAIMVFGKMVFRKDAMGEGDAWYWAFLGGFLGAQDILVALVLACFFGSFIGSIRYFFSKDHYIPFGPFLSMGALTMMFFGDRVYGFVRWYQTLFV
jgi:leader peptidase (prepilin peptidase)/N-methyltransferase